MSSISGCCIKQDYHSIMIIVSVVEYILLVLYLEYHNGIRDCCI